MGSTQFITLGTLILLLNSICHSPVLTKFLNSNNLKTNNQFSKEKASHVILNDFEKEKIMDLIEKLSAKLLIETDDTNSICSIKHCCLDYLRQSSNNDVLLNYYIFLKNAIEKKENFNINEYKFVIDTILKEKCLCGSKELVCQNKLGFAKHFDNSELVLLMTPYFKDNSENSLSTLRNGEISIFRKKTNEKKSILTHLLSKNRHSINTSNILFRVNKISRF